MSLLTRSLSAITVETILSLPASGMRESREIDYKREYSLREDNQKREFARDVAAFANTVGGDLVFGIEEKDGLPTGVPGLGDFNEDAERLCIESLISSALAPRLTGLAFRSFEIGGSKKVFVVRVPRSLNAPHMVTYNGDNRFYGRHTSGRFPMDVNQVRDSFADGDTLSDKLRGFRAQRIEWIQRREAGVRFATTHLTALHILPLAAVRRGSLFDGRALQKIDPAKLEPMRIAGGYSRALNLDGVRVYSSLGAGKIAGYVQLFRNGCLEAVDGDMLMHQQNKIMLAYERTVRDAVHRLLGTLGALEIGGPLAIGLSLLQVRGFTFAQPSFALEEPQLIEEENLIVPEVIVDADATADDIDRALQPAFDLVWNACGKIGSPNYDASGRWISERDPFRSR